MKNCILLSGGMDSTALAFWKRPKIAITIDYGQLSALGEIRAAKKITAELNIQHEIITVDCRSLGSGDLAGLPESSFAPVSEWWPFRNQLLITLASMRAINLDVNEIICGSVKTDSLHIDGRPDFFNAINYLTSMQEGTIQVSAPAINLTSKELVDISGIDISLLAWSHSCHTAAFACGNCRGCYKHQNVMAQLGYDAF